MMTGRRWWLAATALFAGLYFAAVGCGADTDVPADEAARAGVSASPAPASTGTATATAPTGRTTPTAVLTPTPTPTATQMPPATATPAATQTAPATAAPRPLAPPDPGRSVVLQDANPRVTAVVYPLPDHPGEPWSQWGQAVVLADGRVVSAVGDHLGRGGNSYLYVYDPESGELQLIGDVRSALDHPADSWGFGKIHGQMVLGDDGNVYFATYWGSRRDLEFDDAYRGDVLFRLDPNTPVTGAVPGVGAMQPLGVPVPGHGIPSLAGDGRYLYGEALDPLATDDDGGTVNVGGLFVFDTRSDELVTWLPDERQAQFRNIIVGGPGGEGGALVADRDGGLLRYVPGTDGLTDSGITLGDQLRASTRPDAAGTVYAVTNRTDEFFAIAADGTTRSLGNALDYSSSLALTPDEQAFLYAPGAHGTSSGFGTPLLAVDTVTGEQRTVVELAAMARDRLGLVLGGSFSIAVDPERGVAHVGFNAGPTEDSPWGEVVQVTVELDGAPSGAGIGTGIEAATPAPPVGLVDVTTAFGLVEPLTGMHGHAVAVADVNGDGWDDLFVGTFADRPADAYSARGADGPRPDQLLLGGPDGFRPDPTFPGRLSRSAGASFADLDNDGDPDLIVSRNVRQRPNEPSIGTELYRNDGGGLVSAGILDAERGGRAVGTLDYDGDGRLDIFLVEDRWTGASSVLYRNRGDFDFVDRTAAAGLPTDVFGLGLGVADLDGNGTDDLVIGGSNRVFLGDGDRGFAESVGAIPPWEIFGPEDDVDHVAIGDLDGDGRPDIVLGHHYNSTIDFDEDVPVRVYLNDGAGGPATLLLRDMTDEVGMIGLPTKAPKVLLADLNHDGLLDIVTTASAGDGREPAVFFHQGVVDGVPRFAAPAGLGDTQYWIDAAMIDADNDGTDELFLLEWEPALPSLVLEPDG